MAISDATLSQPQFEAALLFFADFVDLPIRGAFAPCPVHVPVGLPDSDADCAGFTFEVANSEVLEIGPVSLEDGGSDTFGFTLLGDPADTALMSAIENPALYVGRRVQLWIAIIDLAGTPVQDAAGVWGVPVTQLKPLHRVYMTQPAQEADDERYVITMAAENWQSLLAGPQGRTDVESTLYDPGDLSGAVIKAGGQLPAINPGGGRIPMPGLQDFTRPR